MNVFSVPGIAGKVHSRTVTAGLGGSLCAEADALVDSSVAPNAHGTLVLKATAWPFTCKGRKLVALIESTQAWPSRLEPETFTIAPYCPVLRTVTL